MRHPATLVKWALFALLLAALGMGLAGCSQGRQAFSLYPYDHVLSTTIIWQFFRDNPSEAVEMEVYYWPWPLVNEPPVYLDLDTGTEAVMLRALGRGTVPRGDPRGWCTTIPVFVVYANGPHYSICITLTSAGFALGSEQAYVFGNPALASALEKACEDNSLMKTEYDASRIRYYLKIGAGEDPGPPTFAEERRKQ